MMMMVKKFMRGIRVPVRHLGALNEWPCPLLRPFSSSSNKNSKEAEVRSYNDAYRQLQNLDFMTAVKMLFTEPPKKKKFGLDFHLVQLFFACMPSLAVFLVAQYARYEIRRMEAEVELKKKQAEEKEKAKEMEIMESNTMEEDGSDSELVKVKVRLEALEEAVKEIVHETKRQPSGIAKDNEGSKEQKPTDLQNISKASSSAVDNQHGKSTVGESTPDASGAKARESTAAAGVSQEKHEQDGSTRKGTFHESKK